MSSADTRVPQSAAWLGGLGALPFVVPALAMPFIADGLRDAAIGLLLGYGAVILSFLGGVHWGLAVVAPAHNNLASLQTRLILSVVPSLIGWAALVVGGTIGLWVLAAAFVAMGVCDVWASKNGYAPGWYKTLRIPLSTVVACTLVVGAIS